MKALDFIATSLNRIDDEPNKALAAEIVKSKRQDWILELVKNLNNKDKNIQSDCIKVLYEIGEHRGADMIAPYYKDFGKLLNSKNNRLVWGAMIALDHIASENPKGIFEILPHIMTAIDNGSVITIDHGVGILAKLAAKSEFSPTAFPLLIEQLKRCPIKQLPMYAEETIDSIDAEKQNEFIDTLESRIAEIEKDSQKNRITKIIKKLKNK